MTRRRGRAALRGAGRTLIMSGMRGRCVAGLMTIVAVSATACSSAAHPLSAASPSRQTATSSAAPPVAVSRGAASPGTASSAAGSPSGAATGAGVPSPNPRQPGAPGCRPASPRSPSAGGFQQEVQGTGHGATLWGLLFFTGSPHTDAQVKIVWRMTGAGLFEVVAQGPGGRRLNPAWGPEAHGSSSWDKPGQEWGTGFTFTVPGCWDLHAARTGSSADVWLQVVGAGRPMMPGSDPG
jgi:hypothetical protein